MQWCCLLTLAISRAPPPVMMGGLTGLPRMPVKAWALTKKWYTADFDETAASAGRQLALTVPPLAAGRSEAILASDQHGDLPAW